MYFSIDISLFCIYNYNEVIKLEKYREIDKNLMVDKINDEEFDFYPYTSFKLEGFPWYEKDKKLYRLPMDIMPKLSESMTNLSKASAGGCIRFKTNSKRLALKVTYEKRRISPGMPQVSDAGFDIYIKENGKWIFINMFRPEIADEELNMTRELFTDGEIHEFALYMPLYSCPDEINIGFEKGAVVSADVDKRRIEKPILFYGSSVTNGGCVAKASDTYSTYIARKLDAPLVNLGFSGNCRGEVEIAQAIADLDLSMFVSEFDHNIQTVEDVLEKHVRFIDIIREKNPNLPIIIMTRPFFVEYRREHTTMMMKAIKENYERMVTGGDKNVYFISGMDIFDMEDRYDYCIDGVHPTSAGNMIMGIKILELIEKNKIF